MVKAFIFDFDGVIIRSERVMFTILQDILKKEGVTLPDQMYHLKVGRVMIDYIHSLQLPGINEEIKSKAIAGVYNEFRGNIEKHAQKIEHTVNFIKNYQGDIQFAIGSMSVTSFIDKVLRLFDIRDRFKHIVSKDDVSYKKPDPEVFNKCLERLGVAKEEAIIFEDSVVGAQAAHAAGVQFSIILNGENMREEFKDPLVPFSFIETEDDFVNLTKSN